MTEREARLILVRHALPVVDPDLDPSLWRLSEDGLAAARRLTRSIPAGAVLVASCEPKAWQTLDPDGNREVRRDVRLGEVRRSEAFSDGFAVGRRAYLSGTRIPGWERHPAVARRFGAAVAGALARAARIGGRAAGATALPGRARALPGGRDVLLASHGMAMTLWLNHAIGLDDPAGFWSGLRFPDVLAVDCAGGVVRRLDW